MNFRRDMQTEDVYVEAGGILWLCAIIRSVGRVTLVTADLLPPRVLHPDLVAEIESKAAQKVAA